jgi:hypothetical protein
VREANDQPAQRDQRGVPTHVALSPAGLEVVPGPIQLHVDHLLGVGNVEVGPSRVDRDEMLPGGQWKERVVENLPEAPDLKLAVAPGCQQVQQPQ